MKSWLMKSLVSLESSFRQKELKDNDYIMLIFAWCVCRLTMSGRFGKAHVYQCFSESLK